MACTSTGPTTWQSAANETAIQECYVAASNGHTITVVGSGNIPMNSTEFHFTKGITLIGPLCTNDSKGRPTSCPCTFVDNTSGSRFFNLEPPAGQTVRLSNFAFTRGTGTTSVATSGKIYVRGQSGTGADDLRRFRLDHLLIDNTVEGTHGQIKIEQAYGVIDHCRITAGSSAGNRFNIHTAGWAVITNWDYSWIDQRWIDPVNFGTDKAIYIEDCELTSTTGYRFHTDGLSGHKQVVRFCDLINGTISMHGTDSVGRDRGGRSFEIYCNDYDGGGGPHLLQHSRSGSTMAWGNTATNFSATPNFTLANEGLVEFRGAWGSGCGLSVHDVNDPTNPFAGPFTITAHTGAWHGGSTGGTDHFTSSGMTAAAYVTHQATLFNVTSQNIPRSGATISNTTTDLEYWALLANPGFDSGLPKNFQVYRINEALDGNCRGQGTLGLESYSVPFGGASYSASGNTITFTIASHGWSAGTWVVWEPVGTPTVARGTWQISNVSTNSFDVVMPGITPPTNDNGYITRVPTAWNNEVIEPCAQWLNTFGASNVTFGGAVYNSNTLRANEHYYNYTGTATTNPQTSGVQAGTTTQKNSVTACTNGVFYWANDAGSWNNGSNSRYTGQGILYRCQSNTWVAHYTPYQYPHQLTLAGPATDFLSFSQNPGSIVTGTNFSPTVTVTVNLPGGGTDTAATGSVSLTISGCGATLSGTTTQALSSGVATFTGLGATGTGSGCTLTATISGGTTATQTTSSSFNVTTLITPPPGGHVPVLLTLG